MPMLDTYDIFFFDFDGLLVDTERLHYMAYCNMLTQRGRDFGVTFDAYAAIALQSANGLKQMILEKFPELTPEWDTLYREKKEAYQVLLTSTEIPLLPGVESILLATEEKRRCVVTNSPRAHIEAVIEKVPLLRSIPWWVTREDYHLPKPAPDGYLHARTLYAREGDKMIGFEDSLRGIRSLQAAGIEPVLVGPNQYNELAEVKHVATFHHLI